MNRLRVAVAVSLLLNCFVIWQHYSFTEPKQTSQLSRSAESGLSAEDKPTGAQSLIPRDPILDSVILRVVQLEMELKLLREARPHEQLYPQDEPSVYSESVRERSDQVRSAALKAMPQFTGNELQAPQPNEEWFWESEAGGGESTLAFEENGAFQVNSIICRSEWCRVEVGELLSIEDDADAELELYYQINESLGRDTTIISGPRNESSRVLFIK